MTLLLSSWAKPFMISRLSAASLLFRFPSSPVKRTLFTRRTFPARTRRFLDMQESLRVRSGLPRGVELVYLLPPYRSTMVRFVDYCSVISTVVGAGVIVTYVIWRWLFVDTEAEEMTLSENQSANSDDNLSDDADYVVDDHGHRWKRRPIQVPTFSSDILSHPYLCLQLLFSFVSPFLVLRIDCARTPLRIFYHPASRHYHAVFSRYFRQERLATFPASRVLLRHGAFRIVTANGSDFTLPNKVMPRHFRDAEHCQVFTHKKFV